MMKLHVFVNGEGTVLACVPAPGESSPRQNGGEPAFTGFFPSQENVDGIAGFEMDIDDRVVRQQGERDAVRFRARIGEMVRKNKAKLVKIFPA